LNVQIPYSRSKAGLHLLVDSTGIKFLGEGEWKCKKHGAEYRRQWRKLHIGIDADTLQIQAICVTSNNVSDASMLCDLLEQLPPDEALKSLTGDGAYDTQPAYEAVIRRGAIPIIPPRKNARVRRGTVFEHRNAAVAVCRRLGRSIWKRWIGYQRGHHHARHHAAAIAFDGAIREDSAGGHCSSSLGGSTRTTADQLV
jgi:hypothetical protein